MCACFVLSTVNQRSFSFPFFFCLTFFYTIYVCGFFSRSLAVNFVLVFFSEEN